MMRGFTLFEMLVAVFMMSILMAGLYGAYTSNVETIQVVRMQGELSQTARIILDLMILNRPFFTLIRGSTLKAAILTEGLLIAFTLQP